MRITFKPTSIATRQSSRYHSLPHHPFQTSHKKHFKINDTPKKSIFICQSDPNDDINDTDAPQSTPSPTSSSSQSRDTKRAAGSTDWISTQLTRRFGIAGGLAWLGILTFGVVSEQIKTRLEIAAEESATQDIKSTEQQEITTPEGIKYIDIKKGGGTSPQKGFLIVLEFQAYANGELFEDTKTRGKPIVYLYNSRPFAGGMCRGVEIALQSMRAGGIRRVKIPAEYGFGEAGLTLRATEHVPEKRGVVPPGAKLEYVLNLVRVSIPPS